MGSTGQQGGERARSARLVRISCGVVALIAVVLGLVAHTFRDALGFTPEAAFGAATGFGVMGALYASVLFWWDRVEFDR